MVYEAGPRFGGVLVTEQVDGCLVEAGPDSFLTEKPWAADLCRRLGLEDQLIGSNDARSQNLHPGEGQAGADARWADVHGSDQACARHVDRRSFRRPQSCAMAREWCRTRRAESNGDESVAALVERHYGAEMVDRLADPLLSGVYGGEASQLSVRAVLPRFVEMESKYGSLGRGMLAARKSVKQSAARASDFLFSQGGMQQLAEALVARLAPDALRANSPVQAVQRQDRGWVVSAGYASDQFDAVIVATPANAAAPLLEIASADLAAELRAISYSSSVTVALGFDQDVRATLPAGFGFLVPRSEGKRMLAATFVHNKFPHRAPTDRALVRCFLGGSRDEQVLQLSDEDILDIVREELRQILGLKAEPLFARVFGGRVRWRNTPLATWTGCNESMAW